MKDFYFISNAEGIITSYDIEPIPQNSNNIRINFCGNYTDTTTVKLAIVQANNITLPTRLVQLTGNVYTVGATNYRVYSYRLVQDDTKICPYETGTMKISFTVEDESETIVTTQLINLTIVKTATSKVSDTPADTIDSIAAQQNQNTADIAGLQIDMSLIGLQLDSKVNKTTQIAGVDLQDNITKSELKTALEINNIDNTRDLNKPVSTAQAAAILQAKNDIIDGANGNYDTLKKVQDSFLDIYSRVGLPLGFASLDGEGKIPSQQLPSYVDDVLEYNSISLFPATGETGKIYVAKDTNLTYRWSGTYYVEISKSLALGETPVTAYRGDRGALMYAFTESLLGGRDLEETLGELRNLIDTKMDKGDPYFNPQELVCNNGWVWDFGITDNVIINITNEPTHNITINNVSAGDIGTVTVKGGQLTLPSNSILSSDFGYLTAVGNQYYRYTFYYDGVNFEWHRTVLGNE